MDADPEKVKAIVTAMLELPREARVRKILDFIDVKNKDIEAICKVSNAMVSNVIKAHEHYKSKNVEEATLLATNNRLNDLCPGFSLTPEQLFKRDCRNAGDGRSPTAS